MPELNLSGNIEPFDDEPSLRVDSLAYPMMDSHVLINSFDESNQHYALGSPEPSSASVISSDHYIRLLDELAKTRSLECQHIRRIYQLERALDQALMYLEELKVKVRDHEGLQDQLSMTEDFAYVQQHAIAHLKEQLKKQKQILISQSCEARDYDEAVQGVLGETEQLVEYQRVELEHLKARLAQDFAKEHRRYNQLEKKLELMRVALSDQRRRSQQVEGDALASRTLAASLEIQLTASQQQVKDLSVRLAESQTQFMALQSELNDAKIAAEEAQGLTNALKQAENISAEQIHTIAKLKRDLAIADTTAARLNAERLKCVKEQTHWKNRCWELEAECDRHQTVLTDLDQHNAAMQEEIFQHTRQVSEYEAANQFWKERYFSSQRQLGQLKQLLEREAPHLSEDSAEDLLQAVQLAMHSEEEFPISLSACPSPKFNTIDMPEFLIRRHALRNRTLPARDVHRLPPSDLKPVNSSDSSLHPPE